jgi:serine protease Do
MGSGFIMRNDGIIVTNAHVVSNASTVSVAMRDGKTYQARVVGTDPLHDVAVVRIDATNLPVAPIGNSADVIVGEWAIAIGNPFGFVLGNAEPSVTAGVISGTGRNLISRTAGEAGTYDMIQTDAAINPGNSGGPLVNAVGEVIGMNTVIYSPSQGSVGLGFAVPINRVKRIVEDLLANGTIRTPWVGIKLKAPESNNPREALATGAIVETVVPGSPAASAGVKVGDQILKANDKSINNYFAWESVRLDLRVGDRVALQLKRDGSDVNVTLRVADEPELSAPKVQVLKELQLVTLTPAIRGERNINARSGAVVTDVSGVPRAWGLQKGDVITQVDRNVIRAASDVTAAFDLLAGAGRFELFFERNGSLWRTVAQVTRQ